VVYGPVYNGLKKEFWEELRFIGTIKYDAWLVCGDFNAIGFRHEKSDSKFHVKTSKRFNSFLEDLYLLEYELVSRKYTWSNGT
jgi:hypothetical protein